MPPWGSGSSVRPCAIEWQSLNPHDLARIIKCGVISLAIFRSMPVYVCVFAHDRIIDFKRFTECCPRIGSTLNLIIKLRLR